jgi:phage tail protein X
MINDSVAEAARGVFDFSQKLRRGTNTLLPAVAVD